MAAVTISGNIAKLDETALEGGRVTVINAKGIEVDNKQIPIQEENIDPIPISGDWAFNLSPDQFYIFEFAPKENTDKSKVLRFRRFVKVTANFEDLKDEVS